eukprot:TRINITY_DN2447_c0_g2_i2.p1 TRINITY_DN2447_c0_g2~~TRINITY_DN2447_c0_g2_i2.p1  ORF type:complete len:642 (+),score=172.85 TRINITY_DN2447_c0_g2_i2:40-1965(+)
MPARALFPAPVPFITLEASESKKNSDDEDKFSDAQFVVHEEAIRLIEAINEPVAVITIAGLYRTGKSFILNQLVNRNNGFDIGSSVEPCTQGIWMWAMEIDSAEVPRMQSKHKKCKIILLDTEGLGSYSKTEQYDVQIFSLALLLSSFFIYNSLGSIDETALDRLSLVVELTKHIRAQAMTEDEKREQDAYQLRAFFPSFLWLVRDFTLELIMQGRNITMKEYLENALQPLPLPKASAGAAAVQAMKGKNKIRDAISAFFPERDCFTLKRPVNDENQLQHLASLSLDQLRPEYLEQIDDLRSLIFHGTQLKKLYGAALTGPMLVELTQQYVDAINHGGVPTIATAWESVSAMECQRALTAAQALYTQRMSESVGNEVLEENELEQFHNTHSTASMEMFRERAVGDSISSFTDQLNTFFTEQFSKQRAANVERSREFCTRLLTNLTTPMEFLIEDGQIKTIDQLEEQILRVLNNYDIAARGPEKHHVASSIIRRTLLDLSRKVMNVMMQQAKREQEAALAELKQRSDLEYSRLDILYNNVDSEWKRSKEENRQLLAENKQISNELRELEKNSADEQRLLREQLRQLMESNKHLADENQQYANKYGSLSDEYSEVKKRAQNMAEEVRQLQDQVKKNDKKCIVM